MTREETKKRFKSWCQEHIGNNASDEDYHMFNNIMALLEQEPCTDAVSREAVIGLYENYRPSLATHVTEFGDALKALPTVIPERPKGEWKTDGHGHIYCTACNQTNVSMWKSDFCPICGSYNGQT